MEKHTCQLCKKETYPRKSGASNLFARLKSAHPSKFQLVHPSGATTESDVSNASSVAADKRSSSSLSSWVVSSATSTNRPCSSGRSEELADLILDWIVDSTRPLSMAGDRGFVALVKYVEPGFTIPSQNHFSSLLRKRHEIGIADLKSCWITRKCVAGPSPTFRMTFNLINLLTL